jgi:cell division protein FtsW (lipid II flippase)
MKLQRQVLNLYRDYHVSPPSVLTLIRKNLGRYLLVIVVFCLVVVLSFVDQRFGLAAFALGLMIGALLRDLAAFNHFTKTWKITESLLDWEKINTLLENESK